MFAHPIALHNWEQVGGDVRVALAAWPTRLDYWSHVSPRKFRAIT